MTDEPEVDWQQVARHLDDLYTGRDKLAAIFPDRPFTFDGIFVGSLGEVTAAYMFGLTLNPPSTKAHDARALDGRNVEIKLTQGTEKVSLSAKPDHLIVLQRPPGGPVRVVYNGPGAPAWDACGKKQKTGQHHLYLSDLTSLDATVAAHDRLPLVQEAPI